MKDRILVTYSSRTGTTAGVSEAIGNILAEGGFAVDVLPMNEVNNLDDYRAVVAGSAIQAGKWLPEALDFVKTRQADLATKHVALFLVCMTLAMKNAEKYRPGVIDWLGPVCSMIKPVSVAAFPGALCIKKVPSVGNRMKFRISVTMGVWKEGDHRDWDAVRTWAEELKRKL